MPTVVVVYHSGFGHTKAVAEHIHKGAASVEGVDASIISADELPDAGEDKSLGGRWSELHSADAIVFGGPTYMGSVSAGLKRVFEVASAVWFEQGWKDKLAAGFTNGGSYSGDKVNALQDIWHNCMQHSMIWVGAGDMMTGSDPESINRMGSFAGMMAQSGNASPEETPPIGDRKTAENFGARVAQAAVRWRA
ncbi:MAG: flavodoxin family protein [Planctomycetota bacterium]